MKVEWDEIPSWVKYVTVDSNDVAEGHDTEPVYEVGNWWSDTTAYIKNSLVVWDVDMHPKDRVASRE